MVRKLTLFYCFLTTTLAAQMPQVCQGPVTATQLCGDACIQCDFNGYTGTTAGYFPTPAPGFCDVVENNQWLGFIAGETEATFTVAAFNCLEGNGLQLALYESCGATAPIACNPGQPGGAAQPLSLNVVNLMPGNHYFLMIDGNNGDQCGFSLEVSPATGVLPYPVGPSGAIQGLASTCPGATVTYNLPDDVPGASYYQWTFPPGWHVNGQNSPVILPAPDGRSVSVTTGSSGGLVSVTPLNACISGTTANKFVSIQPIPPTILPPITIPFDSLPFLWINGDVIYNSGIYQTTFTSWLGCDSMVRQQVIITNPVYTSGRVFADLNGDNVYNGADFPLGDLIVSTSSGKLSKTAPNGTYVFNNLAAGDTIRAAVNINGVNINPNYHLKLANQNLGYDFAVTDAGSTADLRIDLTNAGPFRPGFQTGLVLEASNNSLIQQPGSQALLYLSNNLDLISASPAPSSTAGDTIYWDLGTMVPGQHVQIYIQVQTLVGTPIGDLAKAYAAVYPLADAIPANNTALVQKQVVGSYDPNDKQVEPPYATPAMLASLPPLEYTVRFQNTGNYPAEIVKIVDTLQSTLDPATFRFLSSSHPCTWKIFSPGVIEFTFANINLPDSLSDEPGSHGFVKYSVRPRPGLSYGDVVENFADIYFDFNQPVRTNTAGTEVVYFIPGAPPNAASMSSRPNPASYKINFAWDAPLGQTGVLRLFTINGVYVTETPVAAGSYGTDLYVADRPEGTYVAWLDAGPQQYVKVVLIKRSLYPVRKD